MTKVIGGYLSGVFDLFHVGHLDLLQQAAASCDRLVVGVLTDEWAEENLGLRPFVPLIERQQIISRLRCVDEVVVTNGASADVVSALGVDLVFTGPGLEDAVEQAASALVLSAPVVRPLELTRITESAILRAALSQRVSRSSVA
ncbi:adenylyltransferase/cytidyltransferase family protein [Kribbella deserti]|uniref:Adenylyltransferase/cytidyltransferase family protein n=1 Tax=Kribbella deserti TaxID=1926257 RepID=A0ABV6QIJ5_9ACTN